MLIADDKIINNIVIETNKYAAQKKAPKLSPFARLNKWYDTNITEIKQLFGFLIWTGLVTFYHHFMNIIGVLLKYLLLILVLK